MIAFENVSQFYIPKRNIIKNVTEDKLKTKGQQGWGLIFICWLIAMAALFGSLFLSEIMGLKPCVLCWWQRVFIYPLAVLFLVGMFPQDNKLDLSVVRYTLPLAVIGLGFAIYHYLVYQGIIPESLQPCSEELSCAKINLELMGFITIPMLSIFAYSAIIVLLIIYRRRFYQ
ncbi:disulfide bond formation protein B [Thalassotalea piscium]|uniref:Disulfide bond formation protein DsbB n=1 Tax=Thalassotalea piscium TaxID=1230533 RepID=A0A7X0TUK8_9GAMM|nr:disulfide bond formation protein B [Thalassotalea piscium]MBB6544259.1 disulfide bond formation protein DsbB [Thalassotalea piscium]